MIMLIRPDPGAHPGVPGLDDEDRQGAGDLMYMCIYIHTYIHTYIYIYTHVVMCLCIYKNLAEAHMDGTVVALNTDGSPCYR